MADKIALYQRNAYNYLSRNGVAPRDLDAVLRECPIASEFNGAAYYHLDDLDAVVDVYMDHKSERAC
jgi:hypothetical protein